MNFRDDTALQALRAEGILELYAQNGNRYTLRWSNGKVESCFDYELPDVVANHRKELAKATEAPRKRKGK